jgi:hypothetical protein
MERDLKKKFGTDYELVLAFYLAKKLHTENLGEHEGELFQVNEDMLQTWIQKRLADEVESRKLQNASVYKMVPYVAKLVVTYRGLAWDEWSPAKGLERHLDTDNTYELLRIAEDSFLVFCFYPEERERRLLRYRQYAFEIGTQAYRTFGHARKNPLGSNMETAFVPLGSLVRDMFIRRS